ncbi:hypothetical protein P167DRAFT_574290 [Morchella conica CCBAS932]|uniref:Uncharacterized protein n=1 Tax=Morchella conica CCBAS932 TaxID=1392247 RepID=A0A3N4KPT4_9PEZI|nr:hypothetical protein P167DRAFT_574290 [Morchella conica CCBAS932]
MPESASQWWFRRLFNPRPQAKKNELGDPSRGLLPASSTPPQESGSSLPEHSDVEATIEPTRACSQERERATSTDETTLVSLSESTTHHTSQVAGPEAAHQAEDHDIATRDFAEESPSSSGQQNIDGIKGIESEGGSEGSKHMFRAIRGYDRFVNGLDKFANGLEVFVNGLLGSYICDRTSLFTNSLGKLLF